MQYLTAYHVPTPPIVSFGGTDYSVDALIATGDTATLAAIGLYPHVEAEGPAPLGYTAWVESAGVWTREPAGTQEERDAATLAQWRASYEIEAWKGRVVLASMPAATEGPIAAFPGASLWNQIEALCQATLPPPEFERFRGTTKWKRNDPQIGGLAVVIGLADEQIDAWFLSAAEVQ